VVYAYLNDYVVAAETHLDVAVTKTDAYNSGGWLRLRLWAMPSSRVTWLPRALCEDGDSLEVGDTDLRCAAWLAAQEGLDWGYHLS
jgi:hypothetical protein